MIGWQCLLYDNNGHLLCIGLVQDTVMECLEGLLHITGPLWVTIILHSVGNALQWRHNEHDCISNHQPHDCLLKRLFRRRSKKTPKLHVTGLCEGNSPVTGYFPAQRSSNPENVSIWWRHHEEVQHAATCMHTFRVRLCFVVESYWPIVAIFLDSFPG